MYILNFPIIIKVLRFHVTFIYPLVAPLNSYHEVVLFYYYVALIRTTEFAAHFMDS